MYIVHTALERVGERGSRRPFCSYADLKILLLEKFQAAFKLFMQICQNLHEEFETCMKFFSKKYKKHVKFLKIFRLHQLSKDS